MKKLAVVITDGVGFRNFILSDVLAEAEKAFDEVVILSCLPKTVFEKFVIQSRIIELEVFQDTFYTWVFVNINTWFVYSSKHILSLMLI